MNNLEKTVLQGIAKYAPELQALLPKLKVTSRRKQKGGSITLFEPIPDLGDSNACFDLLEMLPLKDGKQLMAYLEIEAGQPPQLEIVCYKTGAGSLRFEAEEV